MKKFLKFSLCVFLPLSIVWIVFGFCIPEWSIKLTEYQVESDKITVPLRIVQLADLHCKDFEGELATLVAEQKPDLILFVGDIVDMSEEDISPSLDTLRELSAIAPLYVSIGNHDDYYSDMYPIDLISAFEQAGATVLDSSYEDITIKGQTIRLGGIYGYCLPGSAPEARASESAYLRKFQSTSHFTLLMSHMPVCWIINGSLSYWDVDCVLSGHTHGGQVILPLIGGLYAPDQGWFPGKCSGYFKTEDSTKHLIVTTGLGGDTPIPRFWNRPEIVVTDLLPG